MTPGTGDGSAIPPSEEGQTAGRRVTLAIVGVLGAGLIALMVFVFSLAAGRVIQASPMSSPASQHTLQVVVAPGEKLGVTLHARRYWHTGDARAIMLDVEMLRGQRVVGKQSCRAFRLEGSGGGCHASQGTDCDFFVPAGGITGLHLRTRLDRPEDRSVTFDGELQLRRF